MSTIDGQIGTGNSAKTISWRFALIVGVLVVGLLAGFGFIGTGENSVAPAAPVLSTVGNQGPGHVPRHLHHVPG